MKFAFLIFKYFPFGGMQRDMLRIAHELVKQGNTVHIFTISWEGDLPVGDISVTVIPAKGLFNHQRYQHFINAAFGNIHQAGFDYIVGFNRMAGLDAHFAADPCFVARMRHRNFLYKFTPRYHWFAECERLIFNAQSDCQILLLSDAEKLEFQHWYHTADERFHFIPPFLSKERLALQDKAAMRQHLRQAFNFKADDFVFLLVGSGFYMKGLDRAILALAALPEALRHNTKLLAVGQDNPQPFKKLAANLGVTANLVISKGRPDIPQLMQGADAYVHPAYRENTGLVLLEALASGLPVLATASCGYAFHIEHAEAGLVCPQPFEQPAFNALFHNMRISDRKSTWSRNGLQHANTLMDANDGSAEANVLVRLAILKSKLKKSTALKDSRLTKQAEVVPGA